MKPKLKLIGQDGNAFMVLSLARKAARKAKWEQKKIDEFIDKAIDGNCDHLLQVCMEYFDVS